MADLTPKNRAKTRLFPEMRKVRKERNGLGGNAAYLGVFCAPSKKTAFQRVPVAFPTFFCVPTVFPERGVKLRSAFPACL